MRNLILFTLVFLLLFSTVACAKGDTGSTDVTTASTGDISDTSDTTTEVDIYADLPAGSFENYQFNILNSVSSTWALNTMNADTATGDTINDAIFERNLAVQEKLGISLQISDSTDVANIARTQYQAQDNSYDCLFYQASAMASLALEGILADINEIEEIDQTEVWWYPQTNGPLNFGNATYLLLSDANLSFYESYYMVAFNKNLLENYSDMKNPYDMVYANEWTIDMMNQMIIEASSDLNGDSVMNSADDQFGVCGATNIGYSVLGSLGVSPLDYDENNIPSFNEVSEKFISAYEKVISTMYNTTYVINNNTLGYSSCNYHTAFSEGRGLFMVEVAGTLKQHREDSIDYGIVTLPKYDTTQEKYMSTITPTGCSCIAILANNSEMQRTGTVIENLVALSHKILMPAYYDITLSYKYAKDETSIDMLDTIYQNGYLEIAYVYNFGSIRNTIQSLMVANSNNISSTLQTIRKVIIKQLDNTVEKLCN